jgi:peptidoglycan/xylan/chitin deacetylase (PgdA/CDA1 family)
MGPTLTRRKFLAGGASALAVATALRPATAMAVGGGVPRVAFTWDDGPYKSLLERGLPLFKRHGFAGTVFALTGRIESPKHPNVCSWHQVDTFANAGWEISNHTRHHLDLREVGAAAVIEDMKLGKQDLVGRGYPCPGFAYPFHQRNERLWRAVADYQEYARAGGIGLSRGVGRISNLSRLAQLPALNMGHRTAISMIQATRQQCYEQGRDLIWLGHHVRPPSTDPPGNPQSVGPGALGTYLRWVAEQQAKGRLRVCTCRDLVRWNLFHR